MKQSLSEISQWFGVWTALVTPLKKNSAGELDLDEASLKNLIDSQIQEGLRGLVIGGSTGEGSLLNPELYKKLLSKAHEITAHRIPLVAGIGIGGTESCLKNLKLARDIGYQAALASPPAYVKTPQRGLEAHYLRLAKEEFPICVYEVPGRSASSLHLETLEKLVTSKEPTARYLVATKDASNDLVRAQKEAEILKDRMALLSGEDGSFDKFVQAGGQGIISVATHVIPKTMLNVLQNKTALSTDALKLIDGLFLEANPIPVKSLLAVLGKISQAEFCEPLCPMRTDLLVQLQELYQKAKN